MKKLFCLTLFAMPLVGMAQQISLGLNGGAGLSKDYTSGGYASAKADIHLSQHFMLGGAIDVGKLSNNIMTYQTGTYGGSMHDRMFF